MDSGNTREWGSRFARSAIDDLTRVAAFHRAHQAEIPFEVRVEPTFRTEVAKAEGTPLLGTYEYRSLDPPGNEEGRRQSVPFNVSWLGRSAWRGRRTAWSTTVRRVDRRANAGELSTARPSAASVARRRGGSAGSHPADPFACGSEVSRRVSETGPRSTRWRTQERAGSSHSMREPWRARRDARLRACTATGDRPSSAPPPGDRRARRARGR